MKKNIKVLILFCLIINLTFMINGQNKGASDMNENTYFIDGKQTDKDQFEKFLLTLKEVPGTWYCQETGDGGRTGWDAKDEKGNVYAYAVVVSSGSNVSTLVKKNKKRIK